MYQRYKAGYLFMIMSHLNLLQNPVLFLWHIHIYLSFPITPHKLPLIIQIASHQKV